MLINYLDNRAIAIRSSDVIALALTSLNGNDSNGVCSVRVYVCVFYCLRVFLCVRARARVCVYYIYLKQDTFVCGSEMCL